MQYLMALMSTILFEGRKYLIEIYLMIKHIGIFSLISFILQYYKNM